VWGVGCGVRGVVCEVWGVGGDSLTPYAEAGSMVFTFNYASENLNPAARSVWELRGGGGSNPNA